MKMAAKQEAPRAANRLARVVKGKIEKPIRVVLYGPEGCGKSTFASHAPAPIFVATEDGTAQIDCARMPDIRSWRDVLDSLRELDSDHEYRTVAIDTADWLEPMIWDYVCAAHEKKTIEDFGYGKGYIVALSEWRRLTSALDALRARGMHVIVIAHSHVKLFKNPAGDDFDRYEMKLHLKAGGLLKEWADCVLFAEHETYAHKKNERVKGVSTGARIVHTERAAAWDAKNRYDLPTELPLDWEAFITATAAHKPAEPNKLEAKIEALLVGMPDDVTARVRAAMKGADAAKLAKIADRLAAMKQIETQDQVA